MGQALLGLDVGTSRIKAVVFDVHGHILGMSHRQVKTSHPRPGWAEQDMQSVWRATASAIRTCLSSASIDPAEICAIGLAGQGDGAWLIDQNGHPVHPAILWNDNRSAPIIQSWQAQGTLTACFGRNGTLLWPGALAPLLVWLRKHEPEIYHKTRWALCCKDWIRFKLSGEIGTDESDGSVPFMDISRRTYDPELADWLELTDFFERLPPLNSALAVGGQVSQWAAKHTGLHPGTPMVYGAVDTAATALGSGIAEPGKAFAILGTTATSAVVMSEACLEPYLVGATVCHAIPQRWMRALGSQAGTTNLNWALNQVATHTRTATVSMGHFERADEIAKASPPGASGVLYLPFLLGERAPFLEPDARAGFYGINAETTRADLLRAVYEGVALSLRDCFTQIGSPVHTTTLAGGGSGSSFWRQLVADVTGCEVKIPVGKELGALGSAIMAGIGGGIFASVQEGLQSMTAIESTCTPDPDRRNLYDDLYQLYRDLVTSQLPFWRTRQAWFNRYGLASNSAS